MSVHVRRHGDENRLCTFYVDGERYGIDILTVREIQRGSGVTPARGADPCVRGLVNLRGQVVTVIDPAIRMGLSPRELDRSTRLVILKTNAELPVLERGTLRTGDDRVALCVDRIADVHSVEEGSLGPVPATPSTSPFTTTAADPARDSLLRGIIPLDHEVIRVMDPAAMLRLEGDARP